MDDGLNIRWCQTAPDRSLLSLALDELNALHTQWPGTVQCDIVVEREKQPGSDLYRVSVDIDFGLAARNGGGRSTRASHGVEAQAVASSIGGALRNAFGQLHGRARATIAA